MSLRIQTLVSSNTFCFLVSFLTQTLGLGGSTISGAGSVPKQENSVLSRNRFQEIQRKTYGLKKLIKHTVYSNFVDPWCEGVSTANAVMIMLFNLKCFRNFKETFSISLNFRDLFPLVRIRTRIRQIIAMVVINSNGCFYMYGRRYLFSDRIMQRSKRICTVHKNVHLNRHVETLPCGWCTEITIINTYSTWKMVKLQIQKNWQKWPETVQTTA